DRRDPRKRPDVRLFLRLRPAADAACAERRYEVQRSAELRGAHGLRIRRLHGVQMQNQIRQQTHLQGGAGIDEGGGDMVTKTIARDLSVTLSGWRLDNPVIPASGTFGFGNEFRDFYDINILGTFSFKG